MTQKFLKIALYASLCLSLSNPSFGKDQRKYHGFKKNLRESGVDYTSNISGHKDARSSKALAKSSRPAGLNAAKTPQAGGFKPGPGNRDQNLMRPLSGFRPGLGGAQANKAKQKCVDCGDSLDHPASAYRYAGKSPGSQGSGRAGRHSGNRSNYHRKSSNQ